MPIIKKVLALIFSKTKKGSFDSIQSRINYEAEAEKISRYKRGGEGGES